MINVTERKKAEEALRASEELFKKLLLTVPEVIMKTDTDGTIVFISEHRLTSIISIPEEFFIGKNMLEFIAEKDKERAIENTIEMFEKPLGIQEYCMVFPGNIEVYCEVNGDIILDSDAKPVGMVYVLRDITTRKKIEEELQLKSLVLDQIKDHVSITDVNGIISYVNQAQSNLLNLERDEIIGRPTDIFGEDPKHGATQKEILEITLEQGALRTEVVNYAKDGSEHFMDCRTQVIRDKNGKAVAISGIATDITDRKQAEDKLLEANLQLTTLIEAIPDAIFFKDGAGRWLITNEEAKKLYKLHAYEWFGKTDAQIGVERPEFKSALNACIAGDEIAWNARKLILDNEIIQDENGQILHLEVRKMPLFTADGNRKAMVIAASDITQRIKAEAKIRESENQIKSIFDNAADAIFYRRCRHRNYFRCQHRCLQIAKNAYRENCWPAPIPIAPARNREIL